jgi:hypothetical protein
MPGRQNPASEEAGYSRLLWDLRCWRLDYGLFFACASENVQAESLHH